MNMVGHSVNRNQFLIFIFYNSGDVLIQFCFVIFGYEVLTAFDGEDNVNVYLRIGIGHEYIYDAPMELF